MAQLSLGYKGAFGNSKTVTKCAAQFSHNVNIFLRIYLNFSPEFGGRDKKEKQKRSGILGFEEFPRPLHLYYGGVHLQYFKDAYENSINHLDFFQPYILSF